MGRRVATISRVGAVAYDPARVPKKSLTLVKKPAASGWVAPDDSFSNPLLKAEKNQSKGTLTVFQNPGFCS